MDALSRSEANALFWLASDEYILCILQQYAKADDMLLGKVPNANAFITTRISEQFAATLNPSSRCVFLSGVVLWENTFSTLNGVLIGECQPRDVHLPRPLSDVYDDYSQSAESRRSASATSNNMRLFVLTKYHWLAY